MVVGVGSTVAGWKREAEKAYVSHPAEKIVWKLVRSIDLLGARCDLSFSELPYHALEHTVFFCEFKVHLRLLYSVSVPGFEAHKPRDCSDSASMADGRRGTSEVPR
jgi:hypothetical protein